MSRSKVTGHRSTSPLTQKEKVWHFVRERSSRARLRRWENRRMLSSVTFTRCCAPSFDGSFATSTFSLFNVVFLQMVRVNDVKMEPVLDLTRCPTRTDPARPDPVIEHSECRGLPGVPNYTFDSVICRSTYHTLAR